MTIEELKELEERCSKLALQEMVLFYQWEWLRIDRMNELINELNCIDAKSEAKI